MQSLAAWPECEAATFESCSQACIDEAHLEAQVAAAALRTCTLDNQCVGDLSRYTTHCLHEHVACVYASSGRRELHTEPCVP